VNMPTGQTDGRTPNRYIVIAVVGTPVCNDDIGVMVWMFSYRNIASNIIDDRVILKF